MKNLKNSYQILIKSKYLHKIRIFDNDQKAEEEAGEFKCEEEKEDYSEKELKQNNDDDGSVYFGFVYSFKY